MTIVSNHSKSNIKIIIVKLLTPKCHSKIKSIMIWVALNLWKKYKLKGKSFPNSLNSFNLIDIMIDQFNKSPSFPDKQIQNYISIHSDNVTNASHTSISSLDNYLSK